MANVRETNLFRRIMQVEYKDTNLKNLTHSRQTYYLYIVALYVTHSYSNFSLLTFVVPLGKTSTTKMSSILRKINPLASYQYIKSYSIHIPWQNLPLLLFHFRRAMVAQCSMIKYFPSMTVPSFSWILCLQLHYWICFPFQGRRLYFL